MGGLAPSNPAWHMENLCPGECHSGRSPPPPAATHRLSCDGVWLSQHVGRCWASRSVASGPVLWCAGAWVSPPLLAAASTPGFWAGYVWPGGCTPPACLGAWVVPLCLHWQVPRPGVIGLSGDERGDRVKTTTAGTNAGGTRSRLHEGTIHRYGGQTWISPNVPRPSVEWRGLWGAWRWPWVRVRLLLPMSQV